MRRHRSLGTTLAAALLLLATGCASDSGEPTDPGTAERSTETSGGTSAPDGGTAEDPVAVEPTTNLLDWQDTGASVDDRVVVGREWRAVLAQSGKTAELTGPGDPVRLDAGTRRRFSEVLLDDDWAVLVGQDDAETRPSEASVVDLATGEVRRVVTPEPASGGSWAMTGGDLYYPTIGDGGAYCLATYALADSNGEDGWCAEPRTGWSGLTASAAGVGMMTFDDARPVACRTLNLLDGSGLPQPVEGVEDCTGWDVAATADGAAWSTVPKPRRQEEARFAASADGGFFDLGPGTTGSLLPCGDSVFFVRDPQGADDPARLMRWTPDHALEVAYESTSKGNAFLGEPACAGDVLTLSSFGEEGDEQVWASVR